MKIIQMQIQIWVKQFRGEQEEEETDNPETSQKQTEQKNTMTNHRAHKGPVRNSTDKRPKNETMRAK